MPFTFPVALLWVPASASPRSLSPLLPGSLFFFSKLPSFLNLRPKIPEGLEKKEHPKENAAWLRFSSGEGLLPSLRTQHNPVQILEEPLASQGPTQRHTWVG